MTGRSVRQGNNGIGSVWHNMRRHIWCPLAAIFFVTATALVLITGCYLQEQYVDYLMERTLEEETAILELIESNLQVLLDEFIQFGCAAAVEEETYQAVEALLSEQGNQSRQKNVLNGRLMEYNYFSRWVEGICVATEDQILAHYSRSGSLWNSENSEAVFQACRKVLQKTQARSLPLYEAFTGDLEGETGSSLFHVAFPLKGNVSGRPVQSILLFSFNMDMLWDSLKVENTGEGEAAVAYGYLTDEKGRIVYHLDKSVIGLLRADYLDQNWDWNLERDLDRFGWHVNIRIDGQELLGRVNDFYRNGLLIYLVVLCGVFGILFYFVARILQPLRRISGSIQNIKEGNYSAYIEIQGENELWKLAGEFNSMITSIREMRNQLEEEHESTLLAFKRQQEAEKAALESQINAHFICNTLNAINYEVMEAGNHRVSVMLKKLSNILRYTFDQKHQNVYMEQEIAWLEQYLYLQKFRFGDEFDYAIRMPEASADWPCCKLMLQPFVENSILHGFEGKESGGLIEICGRLLPGDGLEICIKDNGRGMAAQELAMVRQALDGSCKNPKIGIGISNVAARIRLYYGPGAEISIDSQAGKGTRVCLRLPRTTQAQ